MGRNESNVGDTLRGKEGSGPGASSGRECVRPTSPNTATCKCAPREPNVNRHRHMQFTIDEETAAAICNKYAAGKSASEIAQRTQAFRDVVKHVLIENGVEMRKPHRIAPSPGLTLRDVRWLERAMAQGTPWWEICAHFRRSKMTLRRQLRTWYADHPTDRPSN